MDDEKLTICEWQIVDRPLCLTEDSTIETADPRQVNQQFYAKVDYPKCKS